MSSHVSVPRLAAVLALGASLPAVAQSPAPRAFPEGTVPPMVVTAPPLLERDQVGELRGYQALTSSSATRTSTPIEQIPQSVTVIPRQLFEDQGDRTVADALRSAAGVVPESPLFLNQNLNTFVRGFTAEIYRDGLQSYFDAGFAQSLLGIERIEVIRGPSSALFGGGLGGGHGGVVNFVSRLPGMTNSYEMGATFGPYGYANPYIDLNQVAGSIADGGVQVSARLQAEYLSTRSYIENVLLSGYQVIPAVTVRTADTSFTVQAFTSERRANDYPGLPPELTGGASNFGIDPYRNANGGNVPRTVTQRSGGRVFFEHRFDEVFTLRLAAQMASSNLEQPAQFPFGPPVVGTTTYARFNGYLQQDLSQVTILPTLEARFTTGPVRHTVLAGIEGDRVWDEGGIAFGFSDIYDFAQPTDAAFVRPQRAPATRNVYTTLAAFLQEQATLWDRVHLLAAARVTQLQISSTPAAGGGFDSTTTRWTPRVGIAVDVLPWLTPYAGWGQGLRSPSGYSFLVNEPKPETSEQWEVGLRARLPFGLTASVAYFDIERTNVPVADPAFFGLARQTGQQRSRGVEVEMLWQPDRNFAFLANYAYTNAEITQDNLLAPGTPLRAVPKNLARAWGIYRFRDIGPEWLHGLSIGGGVTVASGAPANDTDTVRTKGYTTFDAQIAYQTGPVRVALVGRNIGNATYTTPFNYFNNSVTPGAPTEVFLTASLRF